MRFADESSNAVLEWHKPYWDSTVTHRLCNLGYGPQRNSTSQLGPERHNHLPPDHYNSPLDREGNAVFGRHSGQ